jgi:hypothetical protein
MAHEVFVGGGDGVRVGEQTHQEILKGAMKLLLETPMMASLAIKLAQECAYTNTTKSNKFFNIFYLFSLYFVFYEL